MSTIKERVFNLLRSMPDSMLSYKDIMLALNLDYKQVTRAIQSLKKEKLIFKYVDKHSGIGRGRGKIAYFSISDEVYANTERVS